MYENAYETEELFNLFGAYTRRIAPWLSGLDHDEVVAEAVYRAWEKGLEGEGQDGNLKAYQWARGTGAVKDWLRSTGRRNKRIALQEFALDVAPVEDDDGYTWGDVASVDTQAAPVEEEEDDLDLATARAWVRDHADTLKPLPRAALELIGVQGLTVRQAASLLRCAPEGARKAYLAAIRDLRKLVAA